jgi:hypothetical protein
MKHRGSIGVFFFDAEIHSKLSYMAQWLQTFLLADEARNELISNFSARLHTSQRTPITNGH